MAPALVEHSGAKERNSISKEYSKIRGCISQFDIDLLNKISHQYPADTFDTKGSSLLEMNNSDIKDRQNISFAKSEKMVSLKEVPVISLPKLKNLSNCEVKVGYKNGTLNFKKEKQPVMISDESKYIYSTKTETTKECKTVEERPSQPIATMDDSYILDYLQKKKESCGLKYFDLNCTMTKLDGRLRQLQAKNVMSHVSSHVDNKLNFDFKRKSFDNKSRKESSSSSSVVGIQLQKTWEDFRKVHDMINFKADDTDGEDDLEIRQRVPVSRSKKKSDNPPPPPDALHNWRIKRAHIGSQCSWLNLKITSLDRKIAEIDKLLVKNKLEKKKLKNEVNPTNISDINVLNTSEGKCEINLVDEQICRRVLPYKTQNRHKYVRSKQKLNSMNHNCRCLPSVASCRLCFQLQKQLTNDTRTERTGKLDWSFHKNLSNENDVSLSFLLEETLRQQRINTKVTISKPTKKKCSNCAFICIMESEFYLLTENSILDKTYSSPMSLIRQLRRKKQKRKDIEHPEKDPIGYKSSSKLASDKNHVRTKGGKGERLKFDEVSRKRSSGIEPGHPCRSRKHRKLSDTEESWKPSTPTEMASPYSQNNSNNSSNSFFPVKQQRKKATAGGDYDINNIVIPYSMAAATRVERIQYKEIPTPGWRNIPLALNGNDEYLLEIELTDDEAYLERHSRCETNEKRKYTDYYQPAVNRRRSYHLSESTASGPPSPLVADGCSEISTRHSIHIHTPIDSPVANPITAAALNCRMANITHIPDDERESSWPLRPYPLSTSDCKNLCINEPTATSSTPHNVTSSHRHDSSTSSPTFCLADTSKYVKYSDSSTNNVVAMSAVFDPPKGTITPNYTPTQTPMPSPLCSPGGTPTDVVGSDEGGAYNPDKWTVKVVSGEPKLDVVTTTAAEQQSTVRAGIVLKLAKK